MAHALYHCRVMHKRLKPFTHQFRYPVFTVLFDLDELGALARSIPFFSVNQLNVAAFYDRDHGLRDGSPLRPWVEAEATQHDIDLTGGKIYLLCFPRMFGYVFNPISVYFCHDRMGVRRAIVYEVKNTFGEQHSYFVPVSDEAVHRHSRAKNFHVSPFIAMDCRYHFATRLAHDTLALSIFQTESDAPMLVAKMTGKRERLTAWTLARAMVRYAFLTLGVIVAIHFEALKLWIKGAQYIPKPTPPAAAFSDQS